MASKRMKREPITKTLKTLKKSKLPFLPVFHKKYKKYDGKDKIHGNKKGKRSTEESESEGSEDDDLQIELIDYSLSTGEEPVSRCRSVDECSLVPQQQCRQVPTQDCQQVEDGKGIDEPQCTFIRMEVARKRCWEEK